MQDHELDNLSKFYEKNGYVSPVKLLSEAEAAKHRNRLEEAEKQLGSLHYRSKVHTILTSPFELATSSKVLDLIEKLIGPNILLYNVTYIIKEPNSPDHVSWHQDLTYWGLSHDDQVSMWLALSPATKESGCMRMVPESHKNGQLNHETTNDESNVLYQGQQFEILMRMNHVFVLYVQERQLFTTDGHSMPLHPTIVMTVVLG